jgi:hypothetical protein
MNLQGVVIKRFPSAMGVKTGSLLEEGIVVSSHLVSRSLWGYELF